MTIDVITKLGQPDEITEFGSCRWIKKGYRISIRENYEGSYNYNVLAPNGVPMGSGSRLTTEMISDSVRNFLSFLKNI